VTESTSEAAWRLDSANWDHTERATRSFANDRQSCERSNSIHSDRETFTNCMKSKGWTIRREPVIRYFPGQVLDLQGTKSGIRYIPGKVFATRCVVNTNLLTDASERMSCSAPANARGSGCICQTRGPHYGFVSQTNRPQSTLFIGQSLPILGLIPILGTLAICTVQTLGEEEYKCTVQGDFPLGAGCVCHNLNLRGTLQ
jgi:hypothetical protein